MNTFDEPSLESWDQFLTLCGSRIEREQGRRLAKCRFVLNLHTLKKLRENNGAVLVAESEGPRILIPILKRMDFDRPDLEAGAAIVVMTCSGYCADLVAQYWHASGSELGAPIPHPHSNWARDGWSSRRMFHGTVESAVRVAASAQRTIAAVFLFDPDLKVQHARSFRKGDFRVAHDRPQCIESFRTAHQSRGGRPPLLVFTRKKAQDVDVDQLRSAYGLEQVLFVDGRSIRVGSPCPPLPAEPSIATPH
jgi:hypothetical protein